MKHQLTEHDIRKMKEEIEHRKVVVRKELLEHVKEARAHGDLSENFEYHAAKKEKNRNESRIRYLERMIRNSNVVEEETAKDTVGINTTVELFFEEDQETDTFSIVTTVLVDTLENDRDKFDQISKDWAEAMSLEGFVESTQWGSKTIFP